MLTREKFLFLTPEDPIVAVEKSLNALICDDMLKGGDKDTLLSVGMQMVLSLLQLEPSFFSDDQLKSIVTLCTRVVEEEVANRNLLSVC